MAQSGSANQPGTDEPAHSVLRQPLEEAKSAAGYPVSSPRRRLIFQAADWPEPAAVQGHYCLAGDDRRELCQRSGRRRPFGRPVSKAIFQDAKGDRSCCGRGGRRAYETDSEAPAQSRTKQATFTSTTSSDISRSQRPPRDEGLQAVEQPHNGAALEKSPSRN